MRLLFSVNSEIWSICATQEPNTRNASYTEWLETVDVFVGHAAYRYSYLQDIDRRALLMDLQTTRTVTFLASLPYLLSPFIGELTKKASS